jgi:hypothetical protein
MGERFRAEPLRAVEGNDGAHHDITYLAIPSDAPAVPVVMTICG